MGSKVYEAPTLKAATKERAQNYERLREQFVGLKKEFGKIVDDGQFQGHGAEAIKGFYQAQSDIVDAWLRFIDVNIEFFKSIPGYAEDANLAGNSMVQVPFLEENVSQGLKSAKDRVADQQDSLQNIFNGINDLVSLTVFSKDPFDEQMDQAEKKRTRTVEAVNAIDQQLTQEYLGLQNLVQQVNELYSAMINATRQGENISPLYFNAEAYKTSTVFKMQSELKTQAAGYVKQKRSERMPSAMKQLSQEAKVYTLKKEKGFFTEIWDNVQSGSGSALDDTVDGLVNMVKNPGETFDGLKYAAAHPIKTGSAAWDQLSTSFNEEVIHGDAGSRAHYFSYMGTQLGVSVLGGKGIDKLSKVSKVDLAKGMGKVKKHTYVVNKKSTAYLEKFNLLFSKERLAADGFTIDLKDFDNVEEEMMVLQASKVREVEGKVEVKRLIPGTPGKVTGGSSAKLGKNMFEEMGLPKTTKRTPYQAQHIIPKEFRSHPVLQKIGIDMDDASNGFFLRVPDADVSVTSRHKGYHAVYSNFVRGKLDEIDIRQDISIIEKQVFELQQKLRLLQEKGLPLYMQDNYLENELRRIKEIGMEQYKKERMDKEVTTPVWKRGGGATVDLWERWYKK
ncbi:T7SS effector LXG polymorphic toxin [Fictibacillus sp. 5RED26]|uniref:T7SS effector LXG polymorphic toxin n=1 Tax=Fictibacillus sp. 5RED26 TaxID=2745876 RepID=UPI001E2A003F|nr:T7SS effector LXG polymorphic toxin [Fictibacillus sp. 5RED26]